MFFSPSSKGLHHDRDSIPQKKEGRAEEKTSARIDGVSARMLAIVLETAGEPATISFLRHAASTAQVTLKTVQNMKEHQEQFQQLADECCALVYVMHTSPKRGTSRENDGTIDYTAAARTLDNTISKINYFALRSASRRWWQRFVLGRYDLNKIGKFRHDLNYVRTLFEFADKNQTILTLAHQCYELQTSSQSQALQSQSLLVDSPGGGHSHQPQPQANEGNAATSLHSTSEGVVRTSGAPSLLVSPLPLSIPGGQQGQPIHRDVVRRMDILGPGTEPQARIAAPGVSSDNGHVHPLDAVSPPMATMPSPAPPMPSTSTPLFAAGFPFNGVLDKVQTTNIEGDYNVSKVNKKVINTNSNYTYMNGRRKASPYNAHRARDDSNDAYGGDDDD
ncbi:hypothetical protein BDN72DRAFT_897847 [Pluteus cervinus]|uniref:Uncharacterized protein n=1 Tax=Pluteus cervinus TaxID=181527 RepID=A0ACD3ATZ6_9AGAR|nr:hypothetical protein BDN72DRAFT_897847 [Pluteus cervinus]